jgi:hypothetical protein
MLPPLLVVLGGISGGLGAPPAQLRCECGSLRVSHWHCSRHCQGPAGGCGGADLSGSPPRCTGAGVSVGHLWCACRLLCLQLIPDSGFPQGTTRRCSASPTGTHRPLPSQLSWLYQQRTKQNCPHPPPTPVTPRKLRVEWHQCMRFWCDIPSPVGQTHTMRY